MLQNTNTQKHNTKKTQPDNETAHAPNTQKQNKQQ